jgi:hypothetical protein
MVHMITVRPNEGGWAVSSHAFENAMLFLSGEKAEAAARALARHVADAGEPAQIEIWLRDGQLAGRFICPPGEAAAHGEPAAH